MARPRTFDPAAVDEALLQVFWSRGYAHTSIEELSTTTGLLRGSLYAAYGGKEEMFRAAARRYAADLAAALATDTSGLDAVHQVLDTVVRRTVDDPQRRGCLILNAIPESHALSAETRVQLQRGLVSMQALFHHRLHEAQVEAGTNLDLEPLAAMLFAASVAIRVLGRAGQDHDLLANIATGAMEAARRRFAEARQTPEPRST
jgi:TetR/AcrR family transcriptional repressor of nem operon